jgi:hypothetical protein
MIDQWLSAIVIMLKIHKGFDANLLQPNSAELCLLRI